MFINCDITEGCFSPCSCPEFCGHNFQRFNINWDTLLTIGQKVHHFQMLLKFNIRYVKISRTTWTLQIIYLSFFFWSGFFGEVWIFSWWAGQCTQLQDGATSQVSSFHSTYKSTSSQCASSLSDFGHEVAGGVKSCYIWNNPTSLCFSFNYFVTNVINFCALHNLIALRTVQVL